MKIAMAGDHAGFAMKAELKALLEKDGHEVVDFGPFSEEGCDLPDFIYPAAQAVSQGEVDRGIFIDGVGYGSAMIANKLPKVFAAVCQDPFCSSWFFVFYVHFSSAACLGSYCAFDEGACNLARLPGSGVWHDGCQVAFSRLGSTGWMWGFITRVDAALWLETSGSKWWSKGIHPGARSRRSAPRAGQESRAGLLVQ